MTATTYHLYRLLLATKLPIKTRRFLKQASQEGRFLNQLHIRLGRKNWACLASVSDLKTEYRVLERLNQSRADLQKRIADLKEQLARADKPAPVMQQEDAPEPIRRSDALTGEIRYRKASILKRQREMERIGKALGKEDPIYQEIERELELMRQHLHHLQVKLASFDQREAETRTDNTALLAAVARQTDGSFAKLETQRPATEYSDGTFPAQGWPLSRPASRFDGGKRQAPRPQQTPSGIDSRGQPFTRTPVPHHGTLSR